MKRTFLGSDYDHKLLIGLQWTDRRGRRRSSAWVIPVGQFLVRAVRRRPDLQRDWLRMCIWSLRHPVRVRWDRFALRVRVWVRDLFPAAREQ